MGVGMGENDAGDVGGVCVGADGETVHAIVDSIHIPSAGGAAPGECGARPQHETTGRQPPTRVHARTAAHRGKAAS
jgi:hypothetical protein